MRYVSTVRGIAGYLAVALLAGCTSVPDEQTLRLNALMDEIADGYAETSQCLSKQQYRHVTIIDEQHLLFRGGANKTWLNKLRNPCRGLRRNDALLFELHGSGACDIFPFSEPDGLVNIDDLISMIAAWGPCLK